MGLGRVYVAALSRRCRNDFVIWEGGGHKSHELPVVRDWLYCFKDDLSNIGGGGEHVPSAPSPSPAMMLENTETETNAPPTNTPHSH